MGRCVNNARLDHGLFVDLEDQPMHLGEVLSICPRASPRRGDVPVPTYAHSSWHHCFWKQVLRINVIQSYM